MRTRVMVRPSPFLPGMYVRFPVEADRDDQSYRDFRIGQIEHVDEAAGHATVQLRVHTPGEPPQLVRRDIALEQLVRCGIMPGSAFVHRPTGAVGHLLAPCLRATGAERQRYYAAVVGSVQCLPEDEIEVAAHCQDPDPLEQLRRFEFQHPVWKWPRDRVVELRSHLQSLTYGIEDLVGSRVRLLAHQAEVIARVLSDPLGRYILADEVGLGKTVEAAVILKGLRRRHPDLKALIVVPRSLQQQWYNELNGKFWLEFPRFHPAMLVLAAPVSGPGLLVSTEDLLEYENLIEWLANQTWGLLIADEAHHLSKEPRLYDTVLRLSRQAERALILSATPIQRRADEYFSLLCLMDPARYFGREAAFAKMLAAQSLITEVVAYLTPDLTEKRFDREDFEEEMEALDDLIAWDGVLASLAAQVHQPAGDRGLAAAQEVVAYLSTNYRIEGRVIRNRRSDLQVALPERSLQAEYPYDPGATEREVLEALYDYVGRGCRLSAERTLMHEYARAVVHAAASSPAALLALLGHRATCLRPNAPPRTAFTGPLSRPAPPREEMARLRRLVEEVPPWEDEALLVTSLIRLAQVWQAETTAYLTSLRGGEIPSVAEHRLAQVLRALDASRDVRPSPRKTLVFTAWPQTIAMLFPYLVDRHGREAVARFDVACSATELEAAATAFQSSARCRILLCDELGGEGRNFQMADEIIHLDLPWTPSQIEQRIGRVDRLGRSGMVSSIVPYARASMEEDLFQIWQAAFQLFTESMSGMEIALEAIQDELAAALGDNARDGLRHLIASMVQRAEDLRAAVRKERYFEGGGIDHRWRQHFDQVSEQFRGGAQVRQACLGWARVAGLDVSYHSETDILEFTPKSFNLASMQNAKFFEPPDMTEALRRARNPATLVIRGTYNRDLAVRHEELVFFAPGDDPWTDAIVTNALEADRGRCAAVLRRAPELPVNWQGLELFYTIQIDPRHLYEGGFDPVHLYRAQGFLQVPVYRLLIATNGQIEKPHSPVALVVRRPFHRGDDLHLGKRDNGAWARMRAKYSPTSWAAMLNHLARLAEEELKSQFGFTADLAEEASANFARQAAGQRAARRWITGEAEGGPADDAVAAALVQGIERPLWRLESVCFWLLQAGGA